MELSPDSLAMLLICSRLGLSGGGPKPLTLRGWNDLARRLVAAGLTPGDLLGRTAEQLRTLLPLTEDEAGRLAQLLARGGGMALELERLESLGIWVLTRADVHYPRRLKRRLRHSAPPILFGAGEQLLLGQPGLAVVGSRDVDEHGKRCADLVGTACANEGLVLYSGGARGVDSIATKAALQARGTAVGVLAHSLERAIRSPDWRPSLMSGDLALITPYSPNAGFSVGAAMGRNRLIYALADYALVIASAARKGGTWAGATEALKAGWVPVFVLDGTEAPEGNRLLLRQNALPLHPELLTSPQSLRRWLEEQSAKLSHPPVQNRLF